jgi:hypothetical protein
MGKSGLLRYKKKQLWTKQTHSPTEPQISIFIRLLELIGPGPFLKTRPGIQLHTRLAIVLLPFSLAQTH